MGGVQVALTCAWLWQFASQFASTLQLGGMSATSHSGAVYATLQPPLQFTFAPQLTIAFAARVQSPLHVPWQLPPHDPFAIAEHEPVHVPLHVPLEAVPSHIPMHVPPHEPLKLAEHEPVHSAEQVPVQLAAADADPSHVADALHVPLHCPVSSPGVQRASTLPGMHDALPLQLASQLTCALALSWH